MRRPRLRTQLATACITGLLATPVVAAPSSMMLHPSAAASSAPASSSDRSWFKMPSWESSSNSSATTAPVASKSSSWKFWSKGETAEQPLIPPQEPYQPSKQISPVKHPFKYFAAAMSETPIARRFADDSTSPTPPAASDSIALDQPVGPPTPQAMIAFAQLSEQQGNIEQARSQFRQALARWPNDVEVLRATARLEDRQGQLAVAESLYQRAVTANPQHAGAYNDLGLCLARSGKLEQSAQTIEQAICLQPDKALYRNNAATVLVELRQDQKALAHLSAVHGAAASNYNLGQLLVSRGRMADAVPYFQTAMQLDPSMEAARVALAQATGTPIAPSQVASEPVPVTPSVETTPVGPEFAPQQPNQPTFPATARGPAWNSSSAVRPVTPPTAMIPQQPYAPQSVPVYQATAPTYQTATAPRYLPPVQAAPGAVVR